MEKKHFSLGASEDNKLVKVVRIVFGIACIAMAAYWINFNINSLKTERALWVTIVFLIGFGLYQIWAGAGKAATFIEIGSNMVRLKKNAVLPPEELPVSEIEKIDIFPLSIIFRRKTGKNLLLRLGTVHYETNEKVVTEIISFAGSNNIPYELIEERI